MTENDLKRLLMNAAAVKLERMLLKFYDGDSVTDKSYFVPGDMSFAELSINDGSWARLDVIS